MSNEYDKNCITYIIEFLCNWKSNQLKFWRLFYLRCWKSKYGRCLQASIQWAYTFKPIEVTLCMIFDLVFLSFLCRGVVVGVDVNPSIGSVVLSQDRHRLGWNIGQKLPSRNLEASLQANVQFGPQEKDDNKDSFCVGLNTYASVSYNGYLIKFDSWQVEPACVCLMKLLRLNKICVYAHMLIESYSNRLYNEGMKAYIICIIVQISQIIIISC